MPTSLLLVALLTTSNPPPGYPATEAPTTATRRMPNHGGHLDCQVGAGMGLEALVPAPDGFVALNLALNLGLATGWRVGIMVPPAPTGYSVSPFAGFLSDFYLYIPMVGNGPPFVLPANLSQPYAGFQVRAAGRDAWVAVSPALVGGQPDLYKAFDEAMKRSLLGLMPPMVEIGWQLHPGLGLTVRTALPFLSLQFSI